ncbi:uncharacterized protein LOC144872622 [Branchiostoma floridae x Branchiostoma japonicum]
MGEKLPGMMLSLLIILKVFGSTEAITLATCSTYGSTAYCHSRDLFSVPQDVPTGITKLRLENNLITTLSQSDFSRYASLTDLDLHSNHIATINNQAFYDLPDLVDLDLEGNRLSSLRSIMFTGLGNLESLRLDSNEISGIQAGTFNSTPKLKSLHLGNNKLANLRSDMITGLGNLEALWLDHNEISDIQLGTFSLTPQLRILSILGNKIKTLRSDMFTELGNLLELRLYNNEISDIQAGTFNSTPQLRWLYLYQNKLTNLRSDMFKGLENLENLHLYNNEISDIQAGTFNSTWQLRNLYLQQNRLTLFKADTFANLTLLTGLRLDSNNIETFPMEALSKLPSLSYLTLNNNQMVTLPSMAYNKLVTISHNSINIDNNPWQCDCRMLPFRQMMTRYSFFKNQIICEGPSNFHGQKLIDICPEDLKSDCEEPTIARFERVHNNTVVEGETLHLACEASRIPTPDITVILPSGLNATVESGGRVTVDANGTITIANVTAADAGLYVCIASSPELGSTFATLVVGLKEPITATMVPATSPPVIVRFEMVHNNTVVEGETLHLVCEASGIPTPDITVILPSGLNVTVESRGRVTVDVNGSISIIDVTVGDNGLYLCVAASLVGSAFATFVVEVSLKEPTTTAMVPIATPYIGRFDRVHNNTVVEGQTLYLICKASGVPTPDITVILPSGQNATVESGGRVSVDENDTISITNVTAADSGLYVCIVASPVGSTFATLVVNVHLEEPTTVEWSPISAPSFSLPVLTASVCGAVAGTVLVGTIILTIWCKRKTQTPLSGPTPAVVFSNASAKVTISGHDQTGEGGAQQPTGESLNARNSENGPGRPVSQALEYEDVLPTSNIEANGEYQSLGTRQQPSEYQSLGPMKQIAEYQSLGPSQQPVEYQSLGPSQPPAEYQFLGPNRNRVPSDELPPLPPPRNRTNSGPTGAHSTLH